MKDKNELREMFDQIRLQHIENTLKDFSHEIVTAETRQDKIFLIKNFANVINDDVKTLNKKFAEIESTMFGEPMP